MWKSKLVGLLKIMFFVVAPSLNRDLAGAANIAKLAVSKLGTKPLETVGA
ncbi:MAG: hypothetical protein BTN85_1355 [Candidatus Methanohalarchaeum thermophilum]|uniref:Uncharacterized protein n=1 Tax=Methanohalarchaeum thermophilum TaxID=1903181 RepID=A0A1Q6DX06_METT1|nr:MAG: hypothetical protein BTN85_1355 [Candidatus Methanohalarchaeum thermophilum]